MESERIQSIEIIRLRGNARTTYLFVRLRAGDLCGLGEASMSGDDATTAKMLRLYFDQVLADAQLGEVEGHIGSLMAVAGPQPKPAAATAVSALEQALWDLRSRQLGVPAATLLGEQRRSGIRLYANINRGTADRSPGGFAERARSAAASGFTAIKCAPFDEFIPGMSANERGRKLRDMGIERVAAVREAIGAEMELMVDCHGRFNFDEARDVVERLRPYSLRWLEEPLVTRDDFYAYLPIGAANRNGQNMSAVIADLKRFRDSCAIPLAGGEFYFGEKQFSGLLNLGFLDYVMPDIKHCGGIAVAKKIADIAEARGIAVSLHNPAGPVSTAASAILASVLPHFDILEYQWNDVPWRMQLVEPAERLDAGMLRVPTGPGLGITLNEELVAQHGIALDAEAPVSVYQATQ